ncbi:L-rhamnose mutarotase [Herbiconiux sp. P16]|uniref:L-rhamnose mutarotase n=1 Tax=Herbiconiux wuyangfengii TaxID=3342794 RepID=UPI0035B8D710
MTAPSSPPSPPPSPSPVVTGYRTRLLPGAAEAYRELHARVPEAVASKLRTAGVLSWTIWIDGDTLFHTIETRASYEETIAALDAIGPVDPAWDEAVAALVDPRPSSAALLPRVWTLDEAGQR